MFVSFKGVLALLLTHASECFGLFQAQLTPCESEGVGLGCFYQVLQGVISGCRCVNVWKSTVGSGFPASRCQLDYCQADLHKCVSISLRLYHTAEQSCRCAEICVRKDSTPDRPSSTLPLQEQ